MTYNQKFPHHKGFTLIELSIVIVIIGLLVAGIVAGSDLTRGAKLRAILSEVSKYRTAVNIFVLDFGGRPGDIPNASSYWPDCDPTPSNCNGDNDGYITFNGISASNEALRAWQQLAASEIIPGTYSGTGSASNTPVNQPPSVGGPGTTYSFHTSVGNSWSVYYQWGSYMLYGKEKGSSWASHAALSAQESYALDTKTDDGRPSYGYTQTMRADDFNSDDVCVNGRYNAAQESVEYLLSNADNGHISTCRMVFWIDKPRNQ